MVTDNVTEPMSRADIRAALIGKRQQSKSVVIDVFGVQLELRQPSFGAIMAA